MSTAQKDDTVAAIVISGILIVLFIGAFSGGLAIGSKFTTDQYERQALEAKLKRLEELEKKESYHYNVAP